MSLKKYIVVGGKLAWIEECNSVSDAKKVIKYYKNHLGFKRPEVFIKTKI